MEVMSSRDVDIDFLDQRGFFVRFPDRRYPPGKGHGFLVVDSILILMDRERPPCG